MAGNLGKRKVQKGESGQVFHPLEQHSLLKTEGLLTGFASGKFLETSGGMCGRWNLRERVKGVSVGVACMRACVCDMSGS